MENSNLASFASLLILAGGKSSRAGCPKGLWRIQGRTWLEHQLSRFSCVGGSRVVVVLGFHHELYLDALAWLEHSMGRWHPWANLSLAVLINPNPPLGPFSSLKHALGWIYSEPINSSGALELGLFVSPVDVPLPSHDVFKALQITGLERQASVCVPSYHEKKGHPVWLSHRFTVQLQGIPLAASEARLDAQIRSLPQAQQAYIPVSESRVVLNLNTAEDFDQFIRSHQRW